MAIEQMEAGDGLTTQKPSNQRKTLVTREAFMKYMKIYLNLGNAT